MNKITKKTSVLSIHDLRNPKGKIIYWTFFTVLVLTALVCVIPALWTVLSAFKDSQEIFSSFSFFPANLTYEKAISRIVESWKYLKLSESFFNTLYMSLGELAVNIVVCGFGGYALSKIKPSGTKLIFTLVVWTMMMPSQIRMVPNYISWLNFPFAFDFGFGVSLLDTFWPMILMAGADTFSVLLFKNAFDGLSTAYVEAAKLDGCTNYGVFFKIMLPMVSPVVMYQAITVMSNAWSNFFTPLLVLDTKMVLPLRVYRLKYDMFIEMNTYFMALVFASLPSFIIYVIFHKKILGGINVGGVKG